ncbi:MAG: hypothetical protein IT378_21900 [Sandaracinaceae bacterium]|nr:hypothetical protein [Sandaracinaceae bacterium]
MVGPEILRRIRACLGALVGGSGHLAAFEPAAIEVTEVRELGDGLTEFHWTATGHVESEHAHEPFELDVPAEPAAVELGGGDALDELPLAPEVPLAAERKSGWIVLDDRLALVRDAHGRVRFHPPCADPELPAAGRG